MAPPLGRPKSENPRINAVPIRLSDDELRRLKAAAELAGITTVGEYVRSKALAAAARQKRK